MIRFTDILSTLRLRLAAMLCATLALAACDSAIYDDEGDCDPHYKVKFKYDWNLKFADAFPNEVDEVTLYILDEAGKVVWSRHEAGPAVKAEGYTMDVDIEPGNYTLLAWGGEGHTSSFAVDGATLGCRMLRDHDAAGLPYVDHDLNRLYHGQLTAQDFPDDEGTYVYTVPMMKNTNDIHVVLQHLSGEPVDKDKFTFTITADNGLMDAANRLVPDELITYYAWRTAQGAAGIILPEAGQGRRTAAVRDVVPFSCALADFTVARLVKYQADGATKNDVRLTVYNDEGEVVFSVPLIDYLLLFKQLRYDTMDDQEFLDRQDDYNMTFFLDEGDRWMNTYIYIESWKVMLQDAEL